MTFNRALPRLVLLGCAIAFSVGALPAFAQAMDHSKMQMPPAVTPAKKPPVKKPAAKKPATKKPAANNTKPALDPHAGHQMPPVAPQPEPQSMEETDHSAMGHEMPESPQPVDHAAMGHEMPAAPSEPREPIPLLTDADRIAAFPEVDGHGAHDNHIHSYWLLDRLETWDASEGAGLGWEASAWIGTDLDRVWLRSEGERVDDRTETADIEVLYGRSISPWWDVVAGIRHDFGEGPSQTYAAIGLMGLAPYKYEVEATAYISQSGQTAARIEAEYDTLLTNRLILQWQAELEFHGRTDELRGIGSGLGTFEAGLRLRYEITRKFAPYIGVAWEHAFGQTADFRRAAGDDINDTRVVAGVRIWF